MKTKTLSVAKIEDKHVREYLQKVYPGSQIYVRKADHQKAKSIRDGIKTFLAANFNEEDICRLLKIGPAKYKCMSEEILKDSPNIRRQAMTTIAKESIPEEKKTRRYVRRNKAYWAKHSGKKQTRQYIKRDVAFWSNHPGKKLAAS